MQPRWPLRGLRCVGLSMRTTHILDQHGQSRRPVLVFLQRAEGSTGEESNRGCVSERDDWMSLTPEAPDPELTVCSARFITQTQRP